MSEKKDLVPYQPAREPMQVSVPRPYTNNAIDDYFVRTRAQRDARTISALNDKYKNAAELARTQTEMIRALAGREVSRYEAQDLINAARHAVAVHEVERQEQIAQARHQHLANNVRRETELTELGTRLNHVMTDYEVSRQQLESQREHGKLTFDIHHRKTQAELLDVELDIRDRMALLRGGKIGEDDDLDAFLSASRDQLATAGIDTSQVDSRAILSAASLASKACDFIAAFSEQKEEAA